MLFTEFAETVYLPVIHGDTSYNRRKEKIVLKVILRKKDTSFTYSTT